MNTAANLTCLFILLNFFSLSAQNYFSQILPVETTDVINNETIVAEEIQAHKLWNKVYLRKLIQVSPRVHYGFGNFQSTMSYRVPNLEAEIAEVANNLRTRFPWVPWKDITLGEEGDILRTRTMEKKGQFFGTVGLNIPIFFLDLEMGSGRFSESLFTTNEVWPPNKLFKMEEMISLMIKRASMPDAKASMTLRVGMELERLLPNPWRPRLTYKLVSAGLDVEGYFLIGGDFSYRPGIEVIDPNAVEHLKGLFSGIPIVPDNAKSEAAELIVRQVESSLPTYFWIPGLRGFGLKGEAFIDIGHRLRINVNYHHEWAKGLKIKKAEWLQEGPSIERTFLSIGITTQI